MLLGVRNPALGAACSEVGRDGNLARLRDTIPPELRGASSTRSAPLSSGVTCPYKTSATVCGRLTAGPQSMAVRRGRRPEPSLPFLVLLSRKRKMSLVPQPSRRHPRDQSDPRLPPYDQPCSFTSIRPHLSSV